MADRTTNNPALKIEMRPEVAQGVYSNFAVVANTPTEFVVDFVAVLPGTPQANVQSRVIMAPEHAKRLMLALTERVKDYEGNFGKIDIQAPSKKKTIAPFGVPKGEA